MHITITKWEIFVPPLEPGALSKTVTVEAANWMEALTAGLDEIGQEGPKSSNLMLDIKDGAFHVTDLQSKRVFEVRPLSTRPAARDESRFAPSTPPPRLFPPSESSAPETEERKTPAKAAKGKDARRSEPQKKEVKPKADTAKTKKLESPFKKETPASREQRDEGDKKAPGRAAELSDTVRLTPNKDIGKPKLTKAAPLKDVVVIPEQPELADDELDEGLSIATIAKPSAPTPVTPAKVEETGDDDKPSIIPAQGDLVAHEIFFIRDEDPGEGGRLTYRERLIAVAPETSSESAEKLLRHYYKGIKKEIAKKPRGKFINLAVFDHVFRERAQRPAIAALDWKDWKRKPNISFPLEAPSVVETSYIPGVEQTKAAATDAGESQKGESQDRETDSTPLATAEKKPSKVEKTGKSKQESVKKDTRKARGVESLPRKEPDTGKKKKKEEGPKRTPSQQLKIGRITKKPDLNEVLVEVFEAMQDLYFIDRKREAIKFAVDLISDKIPCRAVAGLSVMGDNPDEMVYVAARGDGVDKIIGKRSPLRGTLLGLAVRQGVAVAVSDAQNDARVKAELEHLIDKETRSVLCVPFTFEGRTFGAAELVNRVGGDSWRQGEIHIVSYVANHLSEYIAQSLDSHEDFEADFASEQQASAQKKTTPQKPPAPQKDQKSAKPSQTKKSRKKKKKR